MSRDFIGSTAGRSFKRSPNRDRITRGSMGGLAAIWLNKTYRCFAPFLANEASQTGTFYTAARSKREILIGANAGAEWTEEVAWIQETNSYRTTTITKSANWEEPQRPGERVGSNISPTRRIYQNELVRQTIDLIGVEHPFSELVDDFKVSFDQLQDYGQSVASGFIRIRTYSNNLPGNQNSLTFDDDFGTPIGTSMPMLYGAVGQNLAFVPFSFPVELPRPSVSGQKVRTQTPATFIWEINTEKFGIARAWPAAASIVEFGCDRSPPQNLTRIYEPNWQAARATTIWRITWKMLFPPVQWNQPVEVFPGNFQNQGPSAYGYPEPTCYPDIA